MINQSKMSLTQNGLSLSNHFFPIINQPVRKDNLTTLPTVIWSLAASFLSLRDLRNLTLTNRVFVEGASKQSKDLKRVIDICIKDSSMQYYYDSSTFMCPIPKSTFFSLPILLQLRSLKAITLDMIKIYQKSIQNVSQPLGKDVLLKCESVKQLNVYNHLDIKFLEAFDKDVCPKLRFLNVGDVDLIDMDNFFNLNGNKLRKISAFVQSNRSGKFKFHTIIDNCPNLRNLTINAQYLNNGDLISLSTLPNLTILDIIGGRLNLHCDNLIPLISSRQMIVLKHDLQLSQKFIDVLADNGNKLTRLEISQYDIRPNISLLQLLENLRNVYLLTLTHCNISDIDLDVIANNCPKLGILNLRANTKITSEGISKLLLTFPKLVSLDLCFCIQLKGSIHSLRTISQTCLISYI